MDKTQGVIAGCDREQEWLLPWWWENYSRCNVYPVAFVDFGMSAEARNWCLERGEVFEVRVPAGIIAARGDIDPQLVEKWEAFYGETLWPNRHAWFRKPIAFGRSPFQRTLWLDLDCEVVGSLSTLFAETLPLSGLALVKTSLPTYRKQLEKGIVKPGEILYNAGVVLFESDSPLLRLWIDEVIRENKHFLGDEHVLSRLIFERQVEVKELADEYNWFMGRGFNINAVIIHWIGAGKEFIRNHGGMTQFLQNLSHENVVAFDLTKRVKTTWKKGS